MMHGHEKSDSAIVAVKPANKGVSKALVRIRQIVAVDTRGGSRMRESRTYGSERGARGWARAAPRPRTGGKSYIIQSLAHGRSHAVVLEIKRSPLRACPACRAWGRART